MLSKNSAIQFVTTSPLPEPMTKETYYPDSLEHEYFVRLTNLLADIGVPQRQREATAHLVMEYHTNDGEVDYDALEEKIAASMFVRDRLKD